MLLLNFFLKSRSLPKYCGIKGLQVGLSESTNIGSCFDKRNTPKFNQLGVLQRLDICDDAKTSVTPKILRIYPQDSV